MEAWGRGAERVDARRKAYLALDKATPDLGLVAPTPEAEAEFERVGHKRGQTVGRTDPLYQLLGKRPDDRGLNGIWDRALAEVAVAEMLGVTNSPFLRWMVHEAQAVMRLKGRSLEPLEMAKPRSIA